jgi:hypothetical protein
MNPWLRVVRTPTSYYAVTTQAECAPDVLSVLGRKGHGKVDSEVVTDQLDHAFNIIRTIGTDIA